MACMTISGEGLTDSVRNLVESGMWREALTLLTEDIEGLGYSAALDILKGQQKLVGTTALVLEEELPEVREVYQETLHSVYVEGRLLLDGARYKVYGRVRALPELGSVERELAEYRLRAGQARYPRIQSEQATDLREYVRDLCQDIKHDQVVTVADAHGQAVFLLLERDFDELDLPIWMANAVPRDAQVMYDALSVLPQEFEAPRRATRETDDRTPVQPPEPKQGSESAPPSTPVKTASAAEEPAHDWHDAFRQSLAQDVALSHGFEGVEAFSSHLRDKVFEAAKLRGEVWDTFAYEDSQGLRRTLRYPVGLATAYALSRTPAARWAPAWAPVSPPDLKMSNDNPLHTDLWLALGHDLDGREYSTSSGANEGFSALVWHLQAEKLNYALHVLTAAGRERVSGMVVRHDDPRVLEKLERGNVILWVPHAGEEFAVLARKAAAVLCDKGGRLAHLVIVGREQGLPVVRIPDQARAPLTDTPAILDLTQGVLRYSAVWSQGDNLL